MRPGSCGRTVRFWTYHPARTGSDPIYTITEATLVGEEQAAPCWVIFDERGTMLDFAATPGRATTLLVLRLNARDR